MNPCSKEGAFILSVTTAFFSVKSRKDRSLSSLTYVYTQSPIIRTSPIRLDPEILGKFKTRALGSSNLRTTSKNLRTASAQIFKAKNQVLLPFFLTKNSVLSSVMFTLKNKNKEIKYSVLSFENLSAGGS